MSRTGAELKPPWEKVPRSVRTDVERMLGTRVSRATRVYGGYAPSATFRAVLADGRAVFLKGTYPLPAGSPIQWSLDQEQRVYQRLARYIRPWAPAYFGSIRHDGWHLIALEFVDGERVPPWTIDRARRATRSYADFHRSTDGRALPHWLSRERHRLFGIWWRRIAREDGGHARVARVAGRAARDARRWLDRYAAELRRAEAGLARVPPPYVLLQFDTRSDNVRLEGDLLRMFDWPYTSVGPPEFDLAAFAQAIRAEDGPLPERTIGWYEEIMPVRDRALRASVAGIAGFMADRAARPEVPELPRLRSIQRRQLKAALPWAAGLLGLPEPAWVGAIPD